MTRQCVILLWLVAAPLPALSADVGVAEAGIPEKITYAMQVGLYTRHWRDHPEHVNGTRMVGLEIHRHRDILWAGDRELYGFAVFRNSYGQPSHYMYWGGHWSFNDYSYAKVSIGLLHGFKGRYQDKIPLNRYGIAPVIIPSVGIRAGPVNFELVILSLSAAMITANFEF